MKIIRNNIEYELTPQELREAYDEKDAEYKREDFLHYIEENSDPDFGAGIGDIPVNLTEAEIEALIAEAQPLLDDYFGNNDIKNDIYWNCVEAALKDAWKEMRQREGEHCEG